MPASHADAARPARVEPDELHPPGPLRRAHQDPGDEVSGEDEEDVDAHVPAAEPCHPGVVQKYEEDRDRAEALEIGAESGSRRMSGPPDRLAGNLGQTYATHRVDCG